jgi:hypothetical protein
MTVPLSEMVSCWGHLFHDLAQLKVASRLCSFLFSLQGDLSFGIKPVDSEEWPLSEK